MQSLFLRFPGGRSKALTLSYDDGVAEDIRLLDMMTARGVKGTFNVNSELMAEKDAEYVPGYTRLSRGQCVQTYKDSPNCEVALHAATHPFLDSLTPPQAMYDVARDRYLLEGMFDRVVRGMAYPMGTFSDAVVEILRMAGIAYSRTTISSHNFALPKDPLRLEPTCHHDDPRLMELLEAFLAEKPSRDPRLFYLWGHAYEFERNQNWDRIETFLNRASGHEDVWYATNIEIIDYIAAFHALQITLDGRIAHNPTSTNLCALMDNKVIDVPAGATVHIL